MTSDTDARSSQLTQGVLDEIHVQPNDFLRHPKFSRRTRYEAKRDPRVRFSYAVTQPIANAAAVSDDGTEGDKSHSSY